MTKPYNIGIDARKLGPTGIGRYTAELVLALAKLKPEHMFHLLVLPDYENTFWQSTLNNLPNVTVHVTTANYYSVTEQLQYGTEIDRLGLDLIHFPNFNTPRSLKTPLVVTVHDLTLLSYAGRKMWPGKRWLYQMVLNRTLQRADSIIVGSKDTARDVGRYMRQLGRRYLREDITVIPHGVSAVFSQKMTPAEVRLGLQDLSIANPYFLVVGAQLVHKNVHGILAAMAELLEDPIAQPYKLVIAGNRTKPAAHLTELLRDPRLADRIIWVGPVADAQLRTLYHGAAALVFPSFKEGFGLPVLEAFACGCPVITSRRSSLPEVGGTAAWYINPDKPAEITRAMRRIIKSPNEVSRKVAVGRRRVKQFMWSKAAALTWKVYEKTLKHSS